MRSEKLIFHIDVNSAFLSWSALERLRGQPGSLDLRTVPSAVGGDEESRHGVVLAKSTPAKKYGITTGEPLAAARRKCPGLIVVKPDFAVYVEQSNRLRALLRRYTDAVIPYSIDEAWAEFENFGRMYGEPEAFANKLRCEIKETLGFTVNIGISTNRLLAKMAGDFKKPDLVHTLFPEEVPGKLWNLPVEHLLFAGKSTCKRLKGLGIYTIGDLAQADSGMLFAHMKKHGLALQEYARGHESAGMFDMDAENKGCGNSVTTPEDVTDPAYARQILLSLCETVGIRLAEETAEGMKEIPFDLCITSPLSRARQTAEIVLGGRKVPIIEDARIEELSFGNWEGIGCRPENYAVPTPIEEFQKFYTEPFAFVPGEGGETILQLCKRTKEFWDEVTAKPEYEDKTILIATHGCALRAILHNIYEDKADFWHGFVPVNCAVSVVEVKDGNAKLVGDDRIYYNAKEVVNHFNVKKMFEE